MARSGEIVSGGAASTSPLRGRGLLVGGVTVIAAFLAMAAVSFACSPSHGNASISPPMGDPGTRVKVVGELFTSPTVEIRWGSETGPLLATAVPGDQGKISEWVTIPESQPGFYLIYAMTTDSKTGLPAHSASTFQVTSAATTADPTPSNPQPDAQPEPASAPAASTPAASTSGAPATAPASTASPVASAVQVPAATAGATPVASAPAPSRQPAAAPQAPTRTPAPGALATATAAAAPAAAAGTAAAPVNTPSNAPAAVEPLPQPWSAPAQAHGLFDTSTPSSRPPGTGITFLALGLAGSLAFASVVGRRRLARARS